jgi:hypothetical protein
MLEFTDLADCSPTVIVEDESVVYVMCGCLWSDVCLTAIWYVVRSGCLCVSHNVVCGRMWSRNVVKILEYNMTGLYIKYSFTTCRIMTMDKNLT